jgi:5-hydroxyisourate hydrolase
MSQITTHVLNTSTGKPANQLAIRLEQKTVTGWQALAQGDTNSDGRIATLLADDHVLSAGDYRMTFDIKSYFDRLQESYFYPYVEIVFSIAESELSDHFHIPLLLSPYGYSTYRGS